MAQANMQTKVQVELKFNQAQLVQINAYLKDNLAALQQAFNASRNKQQNLQNGAEIEGFSPPSSTNNVHSPTHNGHKPGIAVQSRSQFEKVIKPPVQAQAMVPNNTLASAIPSNLGRGAIANPILEKQTQNGHYSVWYTNPQVHNHESVQKVCNEVHLGVTLLPFQTTTN